MGLEPCPRGTLRVRPEQTLTETYRFSLMPARIHDHFTWTDSNTSNVDLKQHRPKPGFISHGKPKFPTEGVE